ncbi:hypothetical protein [Methylobacterium fujisawaense]|uniref:hypothetical protein n=1 Tax=Methylobacterium fujisawaense TaxID=107400 RepID=UPI00313E8135
MAADQIETLKGLLERVKAAEKADRQLDRDICKALLPAEKERGYYNWLGMRPKGENLPASAYWVNNSYVVTASVDAALALMERVLPGWDAHIYRDDDDGGRFAAEMVWPPGTDIGEAGDYEMDGRHAATRALAIVEGILASKLVLLEAQNAPKAAPLPETGSENTGGRNGPQA